MPVTRVIVGRFAAAALLFAPILPADTLAAQASASLEAQAPASLEGQVPASADTAPPVETFVERALANAPSLAARRERIAAAQVTVRASDALPDPMVEVEYRAFNFPRYTIGSDPNSMAGATIRQGLSSPGRRRARRAAAEAEAARRAAEQRLSAADLATEVRVQYARLYEIDRERDTLADAGQLARMLEATVTARYAAGGADQASVLRAQLEQTRLGQRAADLEAERTVVQAAINRLMNVPAETHIGRVADLPSAALPPLASLLGQGSPDQAPSVAVRRADVDVAAREVDSARAELGPSWSVGVGIFWQGGLDRMVNLSVGVELPFWKKRKQLPLLLAAQAERRAAELDVADAAAKVRAEGLGLVAEHHNATDQIRRYEDGLLPQNSAALDAARAGYLGGRGEFVSVLDEFRRWIELRTELARRRADRYVAHVRLAALLGGAGTLPPASTATTASSR